MHVAFLSLRDFRSYESVEMSMSPGVSVFVGPNGAGKTNLLEALGYVATLASHRVATDGPLVRAGADRSVVRAVVRTGGAEGGRDSLAEIEINPGRANRARLNRSQLPRLRDLLGVLRVVLFSPDDLALVKGDPAERRRFLDETLVARTPRHAAVRADYERVVKQRNALLKSASSVGRRQGGKGAGTEVASTLDVWDAHLARTGAELIAARLELLAALRPRAQDAYDALARTGAHPQLRYVSSLDTEEDPEPDRAALESALLEKLAESRGAELERGISLAGPHRDELALALGDLPARGYASQGESWSLALALRLAAYELLRGDGIEPVLLLDDVFAELDSVRRDRLAHLVAGAEQVLVTAAYAGDVPQTLEGVRMHVSGGDVRPATPGEGGVTGDPP